MKYRSGFVSNSSSSSFCIIGFNANRLSEDEFYEFQDKYGDNLSIYDGDEIGQCIGLWAESYLENNSIKQAKPIVLSDMQSIMSAEDFNKLVKTCGSIKFLFDGYYS